MRYVALLRGINVGGNTLIRMADLKFLRPGADAKRIVRELGPDPAVEEVRAISGAILWATRRDALNRSVIRKLIGAAVYKELTVRNLNTTLKLHELLGGP